MEGTINMRYTIDMKNKLVDFYGEDEHGQEICVGALTLEECKDVFVGIMASDLARNEEAYEQYRIVYRIRDMKKHLVKENKPFKLLFLESLELLMESLM